MKHPRGTTLSFYACLMLFCALVPSAAGAQTAYISAELPDDVCAPTATSCYRGAVLVVDSTTGSIQNVIDFWRSAPTQNTSHDIAALQVSPDGSRLYVLWDFLAFGNGLPPYVFRTLEVFSTATLAKLDQTTFGGLAGGMTISPDGTRLFVARSQLSSDVLVLDAATLDPITSFLAGFPRQVEISPNGQRLYVGAGSSVDVRDATTLANVTTISLPTSVVQLEVSTDGTHLYAVLATGAIADIDTAANTISATLTDFGAGATLAKGVVSANHRLWVTVRSATDTTTEEKVTVFDQATRVIVAEYSMPRPFHLAATGDQKRVMVTSPGDRWRTIDAITGSVIVSAPALGSTSTPDNRVAFGPAAATSQLVIDLPANNGAVAQPFDFGGWGVEVFGFGDGPGFDQISVTATPHGGGALIALGNADYFRARPDIAAIFGPGYANAGYLMSVNGLTPGTYTLTSSARSARTGATVAQRSVDVVVTIASPTTTLTRNPAVVNFGAARDSSGLLTYATAPQPVTVGFTGAPATWTATSNQPWARVTNGSAAGAGQFMVSIDNTGDPIGSATSLIATITIVAPTANPITVTVNLAVQQSAAGSASPFGQVDTPLQGATGIVGALGVTGWALDDIGVSAITIYRECQPFEIQESCATVDGRSLVFVGEAQFLAGARPDVEAAFPTFPRNNAAGWGMQILTSMLPDIPAQQPIGGQGTFALYVYASDAESHLTLLGRTSIDHTPTTVTLDNDAIAKPFGMIDTPALGDTVSGTIANFGWALTPDANTIADGTDVLIPVNGSTIVMFIDGVARATAAYNHCRGTVGTPPPAGVFCDDDVANLFGNATPQLPLTPRSSNPTKFRNLDAGRGAIGVFVIDTTTLGNGLHTIAWSVTDSASRVEGIGSRFFTVLNGGSGQSRASVQELLERPAIDRGPAGALDRLRSSRRRVSLRTGFDLTTPMRALDLPGDGIARVTIPATGRVEISLAGPVRAGYLIVNGALRDLPVGSTLDVASGVFSWTPPPGMLGSYRLAIVAGNEKVVVDVVVGGK